MIDVNIIEIVTVSIVTAFFILYGLKYNRLPFGLTNILRSIAHKIDNALEDVIKRYTDKNKRSCRSNPKYSVSYPIQTNSEEVNSFSQKEPTTKNYTNVINESLQRNSIDIPFNKSHTSNEANTRKYNAGIRGNPEHDKGSSQKNDKRGYNPTGFFIHTRIIRRLKDKCNQKQREPKHRYSPLSHPCS
jgi:hypothetical protein